MYSLVVVVRDITLSFKYGGGLVALMDVMN